MPRSERWPVGGGSRAGLSGHEFSAPGCAQRCGVRITGTAGEAEASVFEIDMTGPTALVMGQKGRACAV